MSVSSTPQLASSQPTDEDRQAVLRVGVRAVIDAMAGEVRFVNENEKAFALFRRGCRLCAKMPLELAAVSSKDTIVAFMVRIAMRKSIGRQLQELGMILVQVSSWRDLLANAPSPLMEVLAAEAALLTALMAARVDKTQPSSKTEPEPVSSPAPEHKARFFLREKQTRRFLTVADAIAGKERCIMTELPASLLICHSKDAEHGESRKSSGECEMIELEERASKDKEQQSAGQAPVSPLVSMVEDLCDDDDSFSDEDSASAILGFVHEGVPALGCFLAGSRKSNGVRDAVTSSPSYELRCNSTTFGRQENFRWCKDARIQHVPTGLWLFVDSAEPEVIALRAAQHSCWEALSVL